jgi:hypothetical protein
MSFLPKSPLAVVRSRNFSLFVFVIFVVAVLDFGQIREQDELSAPTLTVSQQQSIFYFKAAVF